MEKKKEFRPNVMTPTFTASYPALLAPKMNNLNGKMEYSVVAVFDPGTDLKSLSAEVRAAVVEKWGADKSKWPTTLKTPIRKCEEKAKNGEIPRPMQAGGFFISLKTEKPPGVIDERKVPITNPDHIYGGCKLRATVRAWAYDKGGNVGVSFFLCNVQRVGAGERLGGRPSPESEFEAVENAGDPIDDTNAAMMDGDIPF